MSTRILSAFGVLLLVSLACTVAAVAGPNAGGALIVHTNPSLIASSDPTDYCGDNNLAACEDVVTHLELAGTYDDRRVWWVIASFPVNASPRLRGVTFGIDYSGAGGAPSLLYQNSCADFELATSDWPAPGSGTALTFNTTQTGALITLYAFAGYSYYDGTFCVIPHPTQGGSFADDSVPSILDDVAGYGCLGFGTELGLPVCPLPPPATGACCVNYVCTVTTQADCAGTYYGDDTTCNPTPCPPPPPATGACCVNYDCTVTTQADCAGTYYGDDTTCNPTPCPPPPPATGACCALDGTCTETLALDCGGVYQGDFTICDPNPCPVPCAAPIVRRDADRTPAPAPPIDPFGDGNRSFHGPNRFGTLIVVTNPSLAYSDDTTPFCGLSGLTDCASGVARHDGAASTGIHVLAAFAPQSSPRLMGVTFGVDLGSCVGIENWGPCGDFELPDPGWPATGTGTAVTWNLAHTETIIDVYWFLAYAQAGEIGQLRLTPHPTQGAWFADDTIPSVLDPIQGLGVFGFNTDGAVPCPVFDIHLGACCTEFGECSIVEPENCAAPSVYMGDNVPCDPNPCPEPTGACCYADGTCAMTTTSGCTGTFLGWLVPCDPNPCPQPGACCLLDGSCTEALESECTGMYLGPNTLCDPNPCPPSGACCFYDGTCQVMLEWDCSGVFQGAQTTCEPNPCPIPTGACCYDDGSCAETTVDDCAGSYYGWGTTCDPNPCPPPGACCFEDGACTVTLPWNCGGIFIGEGTTCDPNPCGGPGACCLWDGQCVISTQLYCNQWGGSYQGIGTGCDPNPCPQLEACCYPNGMCGMELASNCASNGGNPMGSGSTCDPNPCPQPTGACCYPDGSCAETTWGDCTGGFWGIFTTCDPNPCPQPGACCLLNGDCIITLEATCASMHGTFFGEGVPCGAEPCEPRGACCVVWDCYIRTEADCAAAGGDYHGDGSSCEPSPCPPPPWGCGYSPAARNAPATGTSNGEARALGQATTQLITNNTRSCGDLVMNSDGSYENGYAWFYGGVVPPYYGAFAEGYVVDGTPCAVVLDLTQIGYQGNNTMDVYVWNDGGGYPGTVACLITGVHPDPIAFWPSISRHRVDVWCYPWNNWWVGYWGAWPGQTGGWYVAADENGPGGCPVTNIAPGIGYPTGWAPVNVVYSFSGAQALGIGAEIGGYPTPTKKTTWGSIKALMK